MKRLQYRAATAAEFTARNPVLAKDEIGIERDTGKEKIGDGTTKWSLLSYFPDSATDPTKVGLTGNDTISGIKTFTGTVALPAATSIGSIDSTELGHLEGVTGAIQTQLNGKVDEVASTDNAVARFDGTGGALQTSGVAIDDSNNLLVPGNVEAYNASGAAYVFVRGQRGAPSSVFLYGGASAGDKRWAVGRDATGEGGSNAGSDFAIERWDDAGTSALSNPLKITRSTGKVTLGDVGSTAGLEFGSSGPRLTVSSSALNLSRSTTEADPVGAVVTKDYVDHGLPSIFLFFEKTSWSAGVWTALPLAGVSYAGSMSSNNRDSWFNDLSVGGGKDYFRVTKAGLYLVSGIFGWSWSGDGFSGPITGVFRALEDQYIQFGMWMSQPNGGAAVSRAFCYPAVQGSAITHISGNYFSSTAIGGSPTSIWASVSVTRIGN